MSLPTFLLSRISRLSRRVKKLSGPDRTCIGDGLGFTSWQHFQPCPPGQGMVSFCSIFQGDHAGVEIATSAHEGLLRSVGLLSERTRLTSSQAFLGDELCEGLVIDDYFAVARVPRGVLVHDPALECLKRSKDVYERFGILGSDDKDVVCANEAKVIGAYINGSERACARGHVLVSSPPAKRYGLSLLTLQACQLSHTADSFHLCLLGGWTSVLMYRRPFMSLLQHSFHVVNMEVFDPSEPKLLVLSRKVVTELVLLNVLAPLCTADIATGFCPSIFTTDASLNKGAILQCSLSKEIMSVAWRTLRSKGAYSKLLTPAQSLLGRCMDFEEQEPEKQVPVQRPLAYRFDFSEIFAGAASVTRCVAALGFSVCCPIDISFDVELDMKAAHVIEWLIHLIANRLIKAFLLEPPCTAFSVMRRPAFRSRLCPFGFDPVLAHRSFQAMEAGEYHGVTGALENAWASKIMLLPGWGILAAKAGCQVIRCDSCAYGSIHLKSFAFMCVWADVRPISKRCSGDHEHVQIQGTLTEKSATYVEGLAEALAEVMAIGIERAKKFEEEIAVPRAVGLENQLVKELGLSLNWQLHLGLLRCLHILISLSLQWWRASCPAWSKPESLFALSC